jgi:hypothetical protein
MQVGRCYGYGQGDRFETRIELPAPCASLEAAPWPRNAQVLPGPAVPAL